MAFLSLAPKSPALSVVVGIALPKLDFSAVHEVVGVHYEAVGRILLDTDQTIVVGEIYAEDLSNSLPGGIALPQLNLDSVLDLVTIGRQAIPHIRIPADLRPREVLRRTMKMGDCSGCRATALSCSPELA
eukprot:TRINITY_DN2323_c0_g1_i8.p1 TRINITY_DN2323_c0_g1~~TRINITY_DN2323_c0_g1_i8.p1  ORF type:complete len:130 (+),score=5.83 TRINITY_DN2323_c0_g1_i8:956-1345(+)